MSNPLTFEEIIGPHPLKPDSIAEHFTAADGHSISQVPIRGLSPADSDLTKFIPVMRDFIREHHSRPEDLARDQSRRQALARQGFAPSISRFPTNPTTRKGNWTEILLCEYVRSTTNTEIPVYRLRYNPNIEQSMKGDDVLAFDLNADPVRVLVGEAKFRSTSTKDVVLEIVESLERSFSGGLPASLQFVADRLIQEGQQDLGIRIENCADLLVKGKLQIDYIGLLASNHLAHNHVNAHAKSSMPRLALISMTLKDGANVVDSCFQDLENNP